MDGNAIMEDNEHVFYALDENGFIVSYDVETNKKIEQTKFVFDRYSDLELLLYSSNWISFPNPVNSDDSET